MVIYRIPGQVRYNSLSPNILLVNATLQIGGVFQCTSGVNMDATLDIAEYWDCAKVLDSCGGTL